MNHIKKYRLIYLSISLLLCFSRIQAQTGGTFEIKQSVIASGGGQQSTGGTFTLDGTIGQSLAGGFFQNAPFSVYNGFWTPETFAPTVATVSIGGRVMLSAGKGIRNARVSLTDSSGETRSTLTGVLGFYRFTEVASGETYILTVHSRRFSFENPTQVVNVTEDLENLNFVGSEQILGGN